jgi:hypothetical protein
MKEIDRGGRPARGKSVVQFHKLPEFPPEITALLRIRSAVTRVPPLIVREYAPPRPGSKTTTSMTHADTLLWLPVIVLPTDGKANLSFDVGNAKGYEILVAGHTLDGRIGAVRRIIPVASNGQLAGPGSVAPAAPRGSNKR